MQKPVGKFGTITAYSDATGAAGFYVVELLPAGFVVLAADDAVEPIIAFSPDGRFSAQAGSPLRDLLQNDTANRTRGLEIASLTPRAPSPASRKWELLAASSTVRAEEVSDTSAIAKAALPVANPSDVRVAPMLQSRWSQLTISSGPSQIAVYNYYTPPNAPGDPGNYPSGCVATAWAQIMRYHQWPVQGVGTGSYFIRVDGGVRSTTLRGGDGAGGPYDWANMVLAPDLTITPIQCQAIGALLHDAGVANRMSYAAGGSASWIWSSAILSTFHYANVAIARHDLGEMIVALRTNLDAGLPAAIAIASSDPNEGGHELVCDGYGYDLGTLYHHLNMGWSGWQDAWYNLPDVRTTHPFTTVDECAYNIDPVVAGEIISGRIADIHGQPLPGLAVTATAGASILSTTTNQRGIFFFKGLASNTAWTITRTGGTAAVGPTQVTVTTGFSVDGGPVGDRIVDDFEFSVPAIAIDRPTSAEVGFSTYFEAIASGFPAPTLQWELSVDQGNNWTALADNITYSGTTTARLTINTVKSEMNGYQFRCAATNAYGSAISSAIALSFSSPHGPVSNADRLINISTRSLVGTDANIQIAGFVISGSAPKAVLIRAAGPALAPLGVSGVLADPILELHHQGTNAVLATNDDWDASLASAFTAVGAFAWTAGSKDAALLTTLDPGMYTVLVKGKNNGTGVALVELYDADTGTPGSKLINISTRSMVGTSDNAQIAGFVVSGSTPKKVVIRAAGPALAPLGVSGVLADPILELHDQGTNAVIASNDNWNASLAADFAAVGAFAWTAGSKDAALVTTLDPGQYTVVVKGLNATTGVALVEVYEEN